MKHVARGRLQTLAIASIGGCGGSQVRTANGNISYPSLRTTLLRVSKGRSITFL